MKRVGAIVLLAGIAYSQPVPAPVTVDSAADYRLGPDDQIIIRALDVEELDGKTGRIDLRGNCDIPLIGQVKAAGLTVDQLQAELTRRLRTYVNDPKLTVTVVEFRSQPVSVLGAVNKPGVYRLTGTNTLVQLLSQAEGLRGDAGNAIEITRRRVWGSIPLPSARDDASGTFSMARVNAKVLLQAESPEQNIIIKPNDVISVPRAEMIYVVGAVRKPGGFTLSEREDMSVLQALSLAEGLERTSSAGHSKIIRKGQGDRRVEIPADLDKILAGRAEDVALKSNDILFVPNSAAKSATLRAIEAAIQAGTGIAVFRR